MRQLRTHCLLLVMLLLLSQLLYPAVAKAAAAPRSDFPRAPAQPGVSSAAASWPGAYTEGPEATIWRRPVVLCLGDSLTQMGSNEYDGQPGWVLRLSAHFNRKADVVNRGFAGFNTKTAAVALPEVLDMLSKQQVAVAILWLGANDAALPEGADGKAHVPVATYAANLQGLVDQLLAAGVERVVLATPPPVFDAAPQAIPPGEKILPRNFKTTQQYAEAARQVAAASPSGKVALLDLWQAFINSGSDWGTRLMWGDGLHLSKAGNDMVYDQLWNVLNSKQLTAINLPTHHADWWFLNYAAPEKQFGPEQAAWRSAFKKN